MSRRDKDELNEQEPWEQPIYDKQDEHDYDHDGYSRAGKRYSDEGRNWYVIILVILLFLIVLVSVGAVIYFNMSTKMNNGTAKENNVTIQSSSTKESSSSSSSTTSQTTSSSTTSSSSSSSSSSSTFEDVEVKPNEANGNQNNATQGNNVASGSTVTYGDSDSTRSLWMIAKSNGTTVEEILELNPGMTTSNIQDGQSIRIK